MKDNLQKTEQRTRQYRFVDGLWEMGFGLIFLLLGLYFFATYTIPSGSLLSTILESSLLLVFLGGGFAVSRLTSNLKDRVTYPRTRYISYRRDRQVPMWVAALIAGAIGAFAAGFVALFPNRDTMMPAFSGIVVSAAWLIIAFRIGLRRLYAQSVASLLLGSSISLADIGNDPGLAIFYGSFALVLFLSGELTFIDYIQKNPPPEVEA